MSPSVRPPRSRFRPALVPVLSALLLAASAQGQGGAGGDAGGQIALVPSLVSGRAEVQGAGGRWQPLAKTSREVLSSGLRTGAGRVVLGGNGGGRVVVGSSSRLRPYQQKVDAQEGQFFFEGPGGVYALGWHCVMDGPGQARVDLAPGGSVQRLAVISGTVRASSGSRTLTVTGGQQLNFKTGQLSAFAETDPWYASQYVGEGKVTVQALRGGVQYRSPASAQTAQVGQVLSAGDRLLTSGGAWAELGFSGGGYLRLGEQSELAVSAVELTSRGREVTLQLVRGRAWNVVESGQGGYKISTPVVSTAVRGTRFRVDAEGLVKVMEGRVELPSEPGVLLTQGVQKEPGTPPQPLTLDAFDELNFSLDAERGRPLTLAFTLPGRTMQAPEVLAESSADSQLSLRLRGPAASEQTLALVPTEEGSRQYRLPPTELPEGRYRGTLRAVRLPQSQSRSLSFTVDRTPPVLSGVQVAASGRLIEVRGTLEGRPDERSVVELRLGGERYLRTLPPGPFQWLIPRADGVGAAGMGAGSVGAEQPSFSLRDTAGNEGHVRP